MTGAPREPDPLRRVLDETLARLEASGGVVMGAPRADVVAALHVAIVTSGLVPAEATSPRDAATLAEFLDRATDADATEWRRHTGTPYASASLDEVRRQAALTYMRLAQGGITREQASGYFASLARRLREEDDAGRDDAEHDAPEPG